MNKSNGDISPGMLRGVLQTPELNIVIFSFLLNFVWEIWQAPFFVGMPDGSH